MQEIRMVFESREEVEKTVARARGFATREAMFSFFRDDPETDDAEFRAREARIQELK